MHNFFFFHKYIIIWLKFDKIHYFSPLVVETNFPRTWYFSNAWFFCKKYAIILPKIDKTHNWLLKMNFPCCWCFFKCAIFLCKYVVLKKRQTNSRFFSIKCRLFDDFSIYLHRKFSHLYNFVKSPFFRHWNLWRVRKQTQFSPWHH